MKPVMLIILDGWGMRTNTEGNAVFRANTPNWDTWISTLERSVLDASEEAVGLIPDQMGNSEVGHLNLGAGRVVYQDISRINNAIAENTLGDMDEIQKTLSAVKASGGNLHLIGLLGDGGVHSHQDHMYALLDITKAAGVNPVVHVITDGRDTPTQSGIGYARQLVEYIADNDHGRVATLSGRYYAMDRDKRWERTQKAYDAMAYREAEDNAPDLIAAIQQSYDNEVTDEFIIPVTIGDAPGIEPGDAIIFYNFRADRMRQIVRAFTGEAIDGFGGKPVEDLHLLTFTVYEDDLPVSVLFDKEILKNTLGEVISNAGLKQYHTAETEKYPHVTFFFNGRNEDPFDGEDREIVPSPKVATYDLRPEMSAEELTQKTLERIEAGGDAFILLNFANPDMVGHTGSLEAAIAACEKVDDCAGRLVEAIRAKEGTVIVTADHGNCERMIELATGDTHTYHTTNPVALVVVGEGYYRLRPRGKLADVAPTVLHLMGIAQPAEMTGRTLIEFGHTGQ